MKELKKYFCKVDVEDYMTVDVTDGELVYFEIFSEFDGEKNDLCVGLTKKEVRELIRNLQNEMNELNSII